LFCLQGHNHSFALFRRDDEFSFAHGDRVLAENLITSAMGRRRPGPLGGKFECLLHLRTGEAPRPFLGSQPQQSQPLSAGQIPGSVSRHEWPALPRPLPIADLDLEELQSSCAKIYFEDGEADPAYFRCEWCRLREAK
jgi:hypothetical protein